MKGQSLLLVCTSSDKAHVDDGFLVFDCLRLIVTEIELTPLSQSHAAQTDLIYWNNSNERPEWNVKNNRVRLSLYQRLRQTKASAVRAPGCSWVCFCLPSAVQPLTEILHTYQHAEQCQVQSKSVKCKSITKMKTQHTLHEYTVFKCHLRSWLCPSGTFKSSAKSLHKNASKL